MYMCVNMDRKARTYQQNVTSVYSEWLFLYFVCFAYLIFSNITAVKMYFKKSSPQRSLSKTLCHAMLSHFSRVRLCVTPQMAATRLPCPWDSPGQNTGVGCHFLLQCMKVKSESEVAQSCLTPHDPMDCSLPGSSIHGIFQAKYWSGVPNPPKTIPSPLVHGKTVSHEIHP